MPKKCYYKPNRSTPRVWRPSDVARVVQHVCESHGKGAVIDALKGTCAESECSDIKDDLETADDWLEQIEDLLDILSELYDFLDNAVVKALLFLASRFPLVKSLFTIANAINTFFPDPRAARADIGELRKKIEADLNSFTTGGGF